MNKPIEVKELIAELPQLKVTEKQREFIKAAIRALTKSVLEKRLGCKVDI